jgi:hypothetical protein
VWHYSNGEAIGDDPLRRKSRARRQADRQRFAGMAAAALSGRIDFLRAGG